MKGSVRFVLLPFLFATYLDSAVGRRRNGIYTFISLLSYENIFLLFRK